METSNLIKSDLHPEILFEEDDEYIVCRLPKKLNQLLICMDATTFGNVVKSYNDDVVTYQRSRRNTALKSNKNYDVNTCSRKLINGNNFLIINTQREAIQKTPVFFNMFITNEDHMKRVYGESTRKKEEAPISLLANMSISPPTFLAPSLLTQAPVPLIPAQPLLISNGQVSLLPSVTPLVTA